MAKRNAADDVLEGKDDVLEGKTASKKASKKPAPAAKKGGKKAAAAEPEKKASKKAAAKKPRSEDVAATDDVRAALAKCKKLTSYGDIAESTGFNIRQIRRTARAMRDAGELTLEKEGTVVFVKRA